MEKLYGVPFLFLQCPNLKLKKPTWLRRPSPMTVFGFVLFSYFLVTGGIIYDIIVEPPSIGSTTDEKGNSKPVAFMPYRVNGQYIMEGLASSFLFSLGGLGFIILDQTNKPLMPKLNRILLLSVAFVSILISFFTARVFMRMKLPMEPINENKTMKDVIKQEFIDYLKNTSIKGVSRIFKSETKLLKIIWIFAVLSFICVGLAYAVALTVEYFKYPTVTLMKEIDSKDVIFPSVTICNLQPYSENKLNHIRNVVKQPIPNMGQFFQILYQVLANTPAQLKSMLESLLSAKGYYMYLGQKLATSIGYDASDIILEFQLSKSSPLSKSVVGLNMVLHIPNYDTASYPYTPYVSTTLGKSGRIQIHEDESYSNVEAYGLSFLTGEETSIRVGTLIRTRLEPPYGKCNSKYPAKYNVSDYNKYPVKKTFPACVGACLQHEIFNKCNCTDPNFPVPKISLIDQKYCQTLPNDISQVGKFINESICRNTVYFKTVNDCVSSICDQTCSFQSYNLQVSTSKWPNDKLDAYEKYLHKTNFKSFYQLYENAINIKRKNATEANSLIQFDNLLGNNIARLKIRSERDSGVMHVEDVPKFIFTDIFSQIGGVLNLWAGITALCVTEILELLFNLITVCKQR
ncbi:DgyrCDS5471 [Dimorphilus gyrociliatus]|uniref:DgyrCDS5471 n=1 Tax=Dimorphilus gyrociliatus TaxID=2664684 RepID=A0A7I8VLL8_9ANNE|nr:DgyrCDS5471 [Dimorphilus gyrociliatus]